VGLGAALLAACFTLAVPIDAGATHNPWHPSRAQMRRLQNLEPYIRYFSSLDYGIGYANVPADYIRALILVESGADRHAYSPKGARGVTQIIPSTAMRVVEDLASMGRDFLFVDEGIFDSFQADDLYNPALNILIACYLTANYHLQYEGRTDLVVSAWNAGPGAVARYGNAPPPYPETRGAIRRIKYYMDFFEGLQVN
jgi:soluble lytic murein transglycosylase-like protein